MFHILVHIYTINKSIGLSHEQYTIRLSFHIKLWGFGVKASSFPNPQYVAVHPKNSNYKDNLLIIVLTRGEGGVYATIITLTTAVKDLVRITI